MVDPVAVFVGLGMLPGNGADAAEVFDDVQLFFAGEVVADVVVMQLGAPLVARALDEQGDGDGGAATRAEDFPAFFAGEFAGSALITAKVEAINGGKFLHKALAEAGHGVVVDIGAVADEGDNAGVSNAVGGPAEGSYVRVVEAVLVGGV